jgi:ribonuclease E
MLDNTPTDTTSDDNAADPAGTPDPAGTAAKKAARKAAPAKAPAKRAPRKAAAKKAAPAVAEPAAAPDSGTGLPAAGEPPVGAGDGAAAPAPAKATRTRKAPARKAAGVAPAGDQAASEDAGGNSPASEAAGSPAAGNNPPASEGAGSPATDSPAAGSPAAGSEAPAAAQAGSPEAATTAPARKAPARKAPARKAPAKRGAAAAEGTSGAEPAQEPAGDRAAQPAADTSAATDSAGTQPAAAEPASATPAKRTPRKRVSKAAAAAAAEQAAADSVQEVPAPDALPAAPALTAPAVFFQPPTEAAPPRRTRGGRRAAAVEPTVPTEPEADTDELDPDEIPGFSDIDADIEPEDVDSDEPAAEDDASDATRRRRRRGRRGRGNRSTDSAADTEDADTPAADLGEDDEPEEDHADEVAEAALSASARRRRRRRRSTGSDGAEAALSEDDPPNTVVHVRDSRSGRERGADDDGVRGVKGSTRLEAKRQRRRDNRDTGRRRAPILTEAEFLARRESVDRVMAVRQAGDRTQIAVLEDNILVEHYVTRASASSAVGNVYLGRVQNVLPSMEAAFVDIGRGRNGVLYAGEVNWDVAGLEGKARSIENALNAGDLVLVQVTKDPIGHKGARLTSQISLPGRFVVYVPGGGMTGISRKLPDVERSRLKAILKKVVPDDAGVIVRTAAEGASEQDLISDVERLKSEWESISARSAKAQQSKEGPSLLHGEPDLAIRVVRDIFNDDFTKLVVSGSEIYGTITDYVRDIAPDLADRISRHTAESDLFRDLRVDEQLAKALDRKVWLPSGGSLVIDRTEAMTVVDVNTGKYTGSGGNLEQTVTRNNLEAAEEIVRQLRLRDIGGIVVIDFIDMVLESNRDLVLRRLTECLGRDRTKHQVAEVTSLGLVQMTRKRVGEGLLEAFSEPCTVCNGRGVIVHLDPVERRNGSANGAGTAASAPAAEEDRPARGRRTRKTVKAEPVPQPDPAEMAAEAEKRRTAASAVAAIAAATNGAANGAGRAEDHHAEVGQSAGNRLNGQPEGDRFGVDGEASGAAAQPASRQVGSDQATGEQFESEEPAGGKPAGRRSGRRRSGRAETTVAVVEPAAPAPAAAASPAAGSATPDQPQAGESRQDDQRPTDQRQGDQRQTDQRQGDQRQGDQRPTDEPRTGPPQRADQPQAGPAPDGGSPAAETTPNVRSRRRRAASRPAGPPVPVSVPEG